MYKAIDTSKDVYTNKSIIIQNPPKDKDDTNLPEEDINDPIDEPTPKTKDYEALERAVVDTISVNDCVAFKMIEMSDSYTPELSGWKEGKVIAKDGSVITFQVKLIIFFQTIDLNFTLVFIRQINCKLYANNVCYKYIFVLDFESSN